MEASQSDNFPYQSHSFPLKNITFPQNSDFFAFLKSGEEEKHLIYPSFFSEKGLSQDIIQVTGAEPDVCLEVFYALYNILWPQIEKQSDISLKDAWIGFIGGFSVKGILCPPEKLITERRVRDLKRIFSEDEGEAQIFHDLDGVVNSIFNLKQKIDASSEEILFKKDILASLNLIQEFYLRVRNQVKDLVQLILEKEQTNVSYASESDALEDLLEPKAIMMSDIFPHHWAFRISRNRARKLLSLDTFGRNLKNNINHPSNHRVIALPEKVSEPLVFFKANGRPPIQPEKEFMLYSLYRHLEIPVPETALLILTDVFEKNSESFYAIQASEAVNGESPLKACQDPETIFDQEAYASQVIGALLTNPSDGSFKNFKYSSRYQTLVSIDNDEVFQPELTIENVVNVKSVLYLLPQIDLPFPDSIKTFFTTLDPHLLVLTWLQDLSKKNQEYDLLFTKLAFQKTRNVYENLLPQSETPSLKFCLREKVSVDLQPDGGSFYPQILLSKNLLTHFIEKLQMIEKILRTNHSVSTQSLFVEISPLLGKYYRKLRFEFSDPEVALEALWGDKKNDIDYSYISSLLDHEEFNQSDNQNDLEENLTPEKLFKEFQDPLKSGESALDRFIKRHNERKKKNVLSLQAVLNELRFLIQEGLTHSQSIREILEFSQSLSRMIDSQNDLIKETTFLLSNLPHPELNWLLTLERYFLRPDRDVPKEQMSSSEPVLGTLMKKRTFLLSESENQHLFNQQGDVLKNSYLTGRSRVTCFPEKNPEFYLKQYPEWPGYEFASTLFMRLLGVTQLPYQDLIVLKDYPVLITQKVHGDPVLRIWHNSKAFHNLDPLHTGLLIISAMLINPEDGKEDNFILSEDKKYLIPIDNDHCFLPSFFQKEGSFWNAFTVNTALQTKTLLFCLDEMYMPVPLEVKQHILSIDFDERLPQWMAELDKLENQFNNLIDQNQKNKFLEQGTVMRIPFYKQFIENMHWKVHKIRDLLKIESQATPFDLLKAVEPFAAKCYQDSFKNAHDLQTRFKAATDQLYTKKAIDGSRMSILNTRTMMEIVNISKEELMRDVAFQRMGPVDAVELLNQLSQERIEKIKIEQELLCELDARDQETKWISLFGDPPIETALKAFFANPKEGLILKGSKLITKNKLTDLFAQTPDKGMRIRFLSLPESPLLTEKEIRILIEECPNLEYLNVSSCLKLKQLTTAEGEWPLLARLEAEGCLNLEKFVSSSPMRILRIGSEVINEIFVVSPLDIFIVSNQKRSLTFSLKSKYFEMKTVNLTVSNDDFIQNTFEKNKDLELSLKDMKISIGAYSLSSGIDLAVFVKVVNLQDSKINSEKIQRMISLNLTNLKKLCLDEHNLIRKDLLKYLIQADWPKLNDFSIGVIHDEGMQILAQGNWPLLEFLRLKSENLTEDGVEAMTTLSKWPQLKHLNLIYSSLNDKAVEILCKGNWIHLEALSLSDIFLREKTLLNLILKANWPNLSKINLDSNESHFSTNILKKNWHLLEELDLSESEITHSEIELIVSGSNWPQLKHLDLSSNQNFGDESIKTLSQGNWPFLETLNLSNTKITALGVEAIVAQSKWPKLKHLNLSSNPKIRDEGLETLSQGNWPGLEMLNLQWTDSTKKGLLNLIFSAKWPNLYQIVSEKAFPEGLLRKNWPLLEELNLDNCEMTHYEVDLIVKTAKLPQLRHLNLALNDIDNGAIETLCQGNWSLLETLDLRKTKITALGIGVLVTQSNWPQLRRLDFENTGIGDGGLEILSQGDWPLLETLNLKRTGSEKKGLLNLVLISKWPNLKTFSWDQQDFATNLLPRNWPLLEELDLRESKIFHNEIELIVERSHWPQLKHLNLSENDRIKDEGLETLSQADWPLLETLSLNSTKITRIGVRVIVAQSHWPQLRRLDFENTGIGDGGLEILSQGDWPLLETLNLKWTGSTKKGLFNLVFNAKWPNLKTIGWNEENFAKNLLPSNWSLLEELDLSSSEITQTEIELIVKVSSWPQLRRLDFENNTEILEKGLEILSQGNWPLLETLNLKRTGSTKKGLLILLLKTNWSNLREIISQETLNENLFRKNWSLLEELDLSRSEITRNEIELIVERSRWPQLKHLNLSRNYQMKDGGLETLSQGNWPLLETLNLEWTGSTKKGLFNLVFNAKWPNLKTMGWNEENFAKNLLPKNWSLLEELNLSNSEITQKEIELILKRLKCPKLKHLNLSGNYQIKDEGLESLSQADWPLLETLNLKWTGSTKKGLLTLILKANWSNLREIISEETLNEDLSQKNWPLLEKLDLRGSKITHNEIELIAKRSDWPQLKHLNLSENYQIKNEGFAALSQADWPLLETLNLSNTKITGVGVKVLVTQSRWPQLKHLKLSDNQDIRDKGLEVLSKADWPLLETLSLKNTKTVTSVGVEALVSRSHWLQLRHLDFQNTDIGDKGLEILSQGNWPLLETLNLKWTGSTKKGLLMLLLKANWPNLREIISEKTLNENLFRKNWHILEELDLSGSEITRNEIKLIVEISRWPQLKHLNLSRNHQMKDEGLEALSQADWPLLETLNLEWTGSTKSGLFNLVLKANWPNLLEIVFNEPLNKSFFPRNWPLLEELDLSKSGITRIEIELLVKTSKWPKLKQLNLFGNYQVKDEGLEILSQGDWPLLETLNLKSTNGTKKGLLNLVLKAKWPNLLEIVFNEPLNKSFFPRNWPLLEELDLSKSGITRIEIELLVKTSKWPKLKHLNLSENDQIKDEGLEILSQGDWHLLETLNLKWTGSTKKGLFNLLLKANWPNLREIISEKPLNEDLFLKNWHLLENLDLRDHEITHIEIGLLVKTSKWPKLKHLNLSGNYQIKDEGLAALSQADWPLLETLNLSNIIITKVGVQVLVTQSHWPQLRCLDFENTAIGDKGLEILSQGDWPLLETLNAKWTGSTKKGLLNFVFHSKLPNLKTFDWESFHFATSLLPRNWPLLEELDLRKSKITHNEVELIVKKSSLPRLKRLNLSDNNAICDEALETLSHADWPLIELLDLSRTSITSRGVKAIVTQSKWPKLKHLDLSCNDIGNEGLEILSQADWPLLETLKLLETKVSKETFFNEVLISEWSEMHFDEFERNAAKRSFQKNLHLIKSLDLSCSEISHSEIKLLVNQAKWPQFKYLNLSHTSLYDEEVETLSQGDWPLLETLNLGHIKISASGVETIVTQSKWPKLKHLNLSDNFRISDEALAALSKGDWPLLETLNLERAGISAEGVKAMVTQSKWPNLKYLDLTSNPILDEGLEILFQGDWPLLETLNLNLTGVTKKKFLNMILDLKWPSLKETNYDAFGNKNVSNLLQKNSHLIESLDLSCSGITQSEVKLLVNKFKWPKLKHLDLSQNLSIDGETINVLSKANLQLLETLNLKGVVITKKGLLNLLLNANWPSFKELIFFDRSFDQSLVQSFIRKDLSLVQMLELNNSKVSLPEIEAIIKRNRYKCHNLKHLNLSNNHIFGEEKISVLVVAECPLLEEIHLENTRIGPKGIKAIVSRSKWPLLKNFNVSNNELFDEGIAVLALADWPELENLNLSNTKLSMKEVDIMGHQSKWLQIKSLNISNNDISEKGLSVLALKEWTVLEDLNLRNTQMTQEGIEILIKKIHLPNLKKLDISENTIFDEGLKTIASGNWPLFQHLVYHKTKVTCEGHIALFESFKWPDLHQLEHSLTESFYNFNEKLDEWSPPKILLALVPMSYMTARLDTQYYQVSVLDMSWLNSKDIYLSIICDDLKRSIVMLPREKLYQLETIKPSLKISLTQPILWPPNLKTLDFSDRRINEGELESLSLKTCPSLESLQFVDARIPAKGLETLVNQSDWPNLRILNLDGSRIGDEGVEILASGKWQLLEDLFLMKIQITARSGEVLASKSDWPRLKTLCIAENQILDQGLEMLSHGKWPLLEKLFLNGIGITEEGIRSMAKISNWPNLKILLVAENHHISDALALASDKWPLLETLCLCKTKMTMKNVETLVNESSWPDLKEICLQDDSHNRNDINATQKLISEKWPQAKIKNYFNPPPPRLYAVMTIDSFGKLISYKETIERY